MNTTIQALQAELIRLGSVMITVGKRIAQQKAAYGAASKDDTARAERAYSLTMAVCAEIEAHPDYAYGVPMGAGLTNSTMRIFVGQ